MCLRAKTLNFSYSPLLCPFPTLHSQCYFQLMDALFMDQIKPYHPYHHCDPFDHNLIFDFNCYCQHHWFCFWQSMTEFRRIPQLEYDTAFHFFDMKYESYCLEIWHYWDNTQYMLIKVYYYDKQIKSSKVETVSVINTSMCVYFCLLKMLLSL